MSTVGSIGGAPRLIPAVPEVPSGDTPADAITVVPDGDTPPAAVNNDPIVGENRVAGERLAETHVPKEDEIDLGVVDDQDLQGDEDNRLVIHGAHLGSQGPHFKILMSVTIENDRTLISLNPIHFTNFLKFLTDQPDSDFGDYIYLYPELNAIKRDFKSNKKANFEYATIVLQDIVKKKSPITNEDTERLFNALLGANSEEGTAISFLNSELSDQQTKFLYSQMDRFNVDMMEWLQKEVHPPQNWPKRKLIPILSIPLLALIFAMFRGDNNPTSENSQVPSNHQSSQQNVSTEELMKALNNPPIKKIQAVIDSDGFVTNARQYLSQFTKDNLSNPKVIAELKLKRFRYGDFLDNRLADFPIFDNRIWASFFARRQTNLRLEDQENLFQSMMFVLNSRTSIHMFGSRKDKDTFMYPDLAVYIDESSEDFMLKGNKHKQKEELFDNNLNGKAPIIIFKPKYLQEVAEKFENDSPILPYWEPEKTI